MTWQPIETAPKDGSLIVLADYSGFRERGKDGMWIATGCWLAPESDLEKGRWWDRIEYLYTPTHWMPLPEPPMLSEPP
jgi:hypothetical protein